MTMCIASVNIQGLGNNVIYDTDSHKMHVTKTVLSEMNYRKRIHNILFQNSVK